MYILIFIHKAFFVVPLSQVNLAPSLLVEGLLHLCFKQAQPKICHSPKVDDGVDIFFKNS